MNNVLKKLVQSENKRFVFLLFVLIFSLMLSSIIYLVISDGDIRTINYDSIALMKFSEIFVSTIKRNLIYFIVLILLTIMGQSEIIIILFGAVSIYYGLSVIYLIRALKMSTAYFAMIFTDYIFFFPVLLYFTFISNTTSKYTKKTKNIETISHKFDIIKWSYIRLSLIYLFIVTMYSLFYSVYIFILSRLLVG